MNATLLQLTSNEPPLAHDEPEPEPPGVEDVEELTFARMMSDLYSNHHLQQLSATTSVRLLFSDAEHESQFLDLFLEGGGVECLIRALRDAGSDRLRLGIVSALNTVVSRTDRLVQLLVEQQAVSDFVKLLSSDCLNLQREASWALGNIAGAGYSDYVLQEGILPPLLKVIDETTATGTTRVALWTLSNLYRPSKNKPDYSLIEPVMPVLLKLLQSQDEDILTECCWVMSQITQESPNAVSEIVSSGTWKIIVTLLSHRSHQVQLPALRIVGNIMLDSMSFVDVIIAQGILPTLKSFLTSTPTLRREACLVFSTIASGTKAHVQALVDSDLIASALKVIPLDDVDLRKEGCWLIANSANPLDPSHIEQLISYGSIEFLCTHMHTNNSTTRVVLNALECILKVGEEDKSREGGMNPWVMEVDELGGLDKLLEIQQHEDGDLKRVVSSVLRRYFSISFND